MGKRRRYQWIDAIEFTNAASVAANGLGNADIVSETEIENLGGGITLERIVGSIIVTAGSVGRAQYAVALMVIETYAGATLPNVASFNTPDLYQRKDNLWSSHGRIETSQDFAFGVPRTFQIDWRSRRKMSQGQKITLFVQPQSNAVRYTYHLRMLFALP